MSRLMANFQKYNERGDRLAIFGERDEANDDVLRIVVFRCSQQDQFSKRTAREAYTIFKLGMISSTRYHPDVNYVQIEEDRPKMTFQKWCHNTWWKVLQIQDIYPEVKILGIRRYKNMLGSVLETKFLVK